MGKNHLKKVAVLGGSRFIGFHLVRELYRQGHDITVFNRGLSIPPAPFPKGIKFVRGDRNRPEDLGDLFEEKFDAVIDIHGCKPEHVEPIVRNYRSRMGHYIYLSTTAVYQSPPVNPIHEESRRVFDKNMPGGNKALAEELLFKAYTDHRFAVTIFRPQGVIGPHDPCAMGLIFYRLMHGLPLFVRSQANTRMNYLYVHDLIRVLTLAMNNPEAYGSAYIVAGDDITTPQEFIGLCGSICSQSPVLKFIDDPAVYENYKYVRKKRFVDFCIPWPEYDQVCDNRKIKEELGMTFTDIETAIRETFSWLSQKPARMNYFRLPGERFILTDEPAPFLFKTQWKTAGLFKDFVYGIR